MQADDAYSGSYRAVDYATAFPDRVGRFVLDAVAPHGQSEDDAATGDVIITNRDLTRADGYCQNTTSCPFQAKGSGSVQQVSDVKKAH